MIKRGNTSVFLFYLLYVQFHTHSDEKGKKCSRESRTGYKWKIKWLGMSMWLQGTVKDTHYRQHSTICSIIVYDNPLVPQVADITTFSAPL